MITIELTGIMFTSFIFGLTSSFHCLTMCGPLVGIVQSGVTDKHAHILYQIGRMFSYVCLGGILGWFGKGANSFGDTAEIQNLAGYFSLFIVILFGIKLILDGKGLNFFPSFAKMMSPVLIYLRKKNQMWALGLLIGALSAFLPCGVLYPAYAVSFATGDLTSGSLVMLAFYSGTFPALFGLGLGLKWIKVHIQAKYVTYFGLFLILISLFFLTLRVFHPIHSENCDHIEDQN